MTDTEKKKGKLVLLPNTLGDEGDDSCLFPPAIAATVATLDGLIAEDPKRGRAFLKRLGRRAEGVPIATYNEHSQEGDIDELLAPILQGQIWGLVTDAGVPCIADPGHRLVARARERGAAVEAHVGPSSLLLAIMLSGLPAQRFAFEGYLPAKPEMCKPRIAMLERRSREEGSVQACIEAPYRNDKLLALLLETLSPKTRLSVAVDLTLPTQEVWSRSIATWRAQEKPDLHKRPALFLFSA